jgi:hypothetical protein
MVLDAEDVRPSGLKWDESRLYGFANIPLECREASLPALTPGQPASIPFHSKEGATRVEFEGVRPTGFSAITSVWMP